MFANAAAAFDQFWGDAHREGPATQAVLASFAVCPAAQAQIDGYLEHHYALL